MSRYIDADALMEVLKSIPLRDLSDGKGLCRVIFEDDFKNAIKSLDNAPTADVVEVVRCKDCKYWQDNNGGYPHEECRWGKEETPDEDDFCSYGERRTE